MPLSASVLAISHSVIVGANTRCALGLLLNDYLPELPPGTLAANLAGAFIIGLVIPTFAAVPSAFWRLSVITGFLGALTTFSTFTAEVFGRLRERRLYWAFGEILIHIGGLDHDLAGRHVVLGIATYLRRSTMKGYEITFMAPRSRRNHGELAIDAVLRIAKSLGIERHTRRTNTESVGGNGRSHSAHFFELADEPEEVSFVLENGRSEELMNEIELEGLQVFCIRQPVEYFRINADEPTPP